MNKLLNHVRSLLVAVPALIALLDISGKSYAWFTFLALLAMLMTQLHARFQRFRMPMLVIELGLFTYFAYTFESTLFLLFFSTLVAAYSSKPSAIASSLWSLGGAACLLFVLDGQAAENIAAILVLWFMTAVLLYAANQYEDKRDQIEQLYEALSLSHIELDAARKRLFDYAAQIEQYAQTEERNRIAKDIHDDLGHRLIRVKMMSEAAIGLFDVDQTRAKSITLQIRDQLQDSMETMRRTVRRLAAPEGDDSRRYALDRLIEQSAQALGIGISFRVQGQPFRLYPSIEFILYKNVQEAITNAVRHGQAASVEVTLVFNDHSVSLTVANDGELPHQPIHAGLGMRGMQERISLLGGKLQWEMEPVFSITTTLPRMGGSS